LFTKSLRPALAALTFANIALAGLGTIAVTTPAQAAAAPKHIFLIMMENHSPEETVGNATDAPFLADLITKPGVRYANQYLGVTHPSLPNYLALVSGSFQGIHDDCGPGKDVVCKAEEFVPDSEDPAVAGNLMTDEQKEIADTAKHMFGGKTIVDQLEAKHLTWKAYMEDMPADNKFVENAPLGSDGKPIAKLYAVKHNPFFYFSSVRDNPKRVEKVVPYDQFTKDLAANDLPNLVWISPNQCHDMHGISPKAAVAINNPDCGYPDSGVDHKVIKLGDDYVRDTVGAIEKSAAWGEGSVILLVWDEDDYAGFSGAAGSPVGRNGVILGGARAPLVAITAGSDAARKIQEPYNHYNLLRTIEDAWHIGCLGASCKGDSGKPIADLF
jgi:hypothetical protein